MSGRHDSCPRCGRMAYYDGHEDWCKELSKLKEKIEHLTIRIEELESALEAAEEMLYND